VVGDPADGSIERAVNRCNQATAGRLKIKIFAGGAVVPGGEEVQSATKGALDVGFNPIGYLDELSDLFLPLAYVSGGLSPLQYMFWLSSQMIR